MRALLILGIAIILGCSTSSVEIKNSNSILCKINVPVEEFGNDNYVKSAKYIFLDQAYLIGKVGRVLFFDKKIFIHDEMTGLIAVFSDDGKYLFRIDNKGKGSMEYLELTDFTIDKQNNDLLIFDEMSHKILTFSLRKNKFIKEKKIDFYPTAFACEADYLYFYNPYTFNYPRKEEYHYSLIQTNLNVKEEERYFEVEEDMGNFMSNPNRKGFFYGNNLFFKNRFENIIYKLNKGNVVAHCEIKFEDNSDYKYALKDAIAKGTRDTDRYHKCAAEVQDYCENNDFITFKYARDKSRHCVIFSKDAKKVIYHKSRIGNYSVASMKDGIPIIRFPSQLNNEMFVSQIPFQLVKYLDKERNFIRSLEENMSDSTLIEKFKKFDANSNPCLAFYKID